MTNHYALERAKAAVISRDYEQAEKILRSILKEEPENTTALSQLGSVYLRADRQKDALNIYQKLAQLGPDSVDALNNLGVIYRKLGRYDESLDALNQARSTGKDTTTVLYNLGNTYKQMGQFDEAEECFIEVIDENPNDVLAYNHLGSIQAMKGEHTKALQAYWRGLQVDPNHPILHYNMGQSYEALGKQDEALSSYGAARRSNPGWIDPMDAEAGILVRDNKIEEAEELLSHALTIAPKHPNILTSMGVLRTKKYDLEEAIQFFLKAIEADERYMKAVTGLEKVYELKGDYEKASQCMSRLESFYPDDTEVRLMYARLLMKTGEFEGAENRLVSILEKEPDNLNALRLQGRFFSQIGDVQKAHEYFSRILKIDPSKVEFLIDLAEQMIEEQNFQGAEEHLLKYLDQRPSDTDGWFALARVYEALGNTDKAILCYRKLLELQKTNTDIMEAVYRLHKQDAQNEEALKLFNDLINSRGGKTPLDRTDPSQIAPVHTDSGEGGEKSSSEALDFINRSLELYEQALQSYDSSNTDKLEKNLRVLKQKAMEEERDKRQEQPIPELEAQKQQPADEYSLSQEETFAGELFEEDPFDIEALLEQDTEADILREYGKEDQVIDIVPEELLPEEEPAQAEVPVQQKVIVTQSNPPQEPQTVAAVGKTAAKDISEDERKELLNLFVSLKMLGKQLTGSARNKYLHSNHRVEMEYVIDRLAGRKGLLRAASAIRNRTDSPPPPADHKEANLTDTLAYMRSLTRELPDESLGQVLDTQIEHIVRKLKYEQYLYEDMKNRL